MSRVAAFAFVPLPIEVHERIEAALERRVPTDDTLVAAVERVTGALNLAYATIPPARLATAARRQIEDVNQLLDLLDEPLLPRQRQRLTAAVGEAAILVGWLAHDVDHRVDARAFFDLAGALASDIDDATLAAKALRCSSALVSTVHRSLANGNPARRWSWPSRRTRCCRTSHLLAPGSS